MRTHEKTVGKTETKDVDDKRERVRNLKKILEAPKYIGTREELVPFSWRHPLVSVTDRKMTKVYRSMVPLDKSLVPSDRNKT